VAVGSVGSDGHSSSRNETKRNEKKARWKATGFGVTWQYESTTRWKEGVAAKSESKNHDL
jgi:hypothetical protein